MSSEDQKREVEVAVLDMVRDFGLNPICEALINTCEKCGFGMETFLKAASSGFKAVAASAEQDNDFPKMGTALHYSHSIRELVSDE